MMEALISGRAGVAVVLRGNTGELIWANGGRSRSGFSDVAGELLRRNASDTIRVDEPDLDAVKLALQYRWAIDRAIRLLQISFDDEEDDETVIEALSALNELLTGDIISAILAALSVNSLPSIEILNRPTELVPPDSPAESLLIQLRELQPDIQAVRNAWDDLPIELFETLSAKQNFESTAVAHRIFGAMVRARVNGDWASARLEMLQRLNDQVNYRTVTMAWAAAAGSGRERRRPESALGEEERSVQSKRQFSLAIAEHREPTRENVTRRLEAVRDLIKKGNEARARSFAAELISSQVSSGNVGIQRASKSLCNLANFAKSFGMHSLQLEWIELAVKLTPEDGRAHSQAADVYLSLGRLDDAVREFDLAGQFNEVFYSQMGEGRIRRAQGKFQEALDSFHKVRLTFRGHENEAHVWNHEAAVLRDMWRFQESIALYEEGVRQFRSDVVLRCGLASTWADVGRHSKAVEIYSRCIADLGENEYALNGRAHAYLQLGEIDSAIEDYERSIDRFPENCTSCCGLADVYHRLGNYEKALELYGSARDRFPFISVPFSGYAEVKKSIGDFAEAMEAFNLGIGYFPFDTHCRNGKANLLKIQGDLEESLQIYDSVLSQFPFDVIAASGRAFILKAMGRLVDAANAYDAIIEKRPGYLAAVHGKASVLVLQQKYSDALALLPNEPPRTIDEWIGYHIRGMVMLRQQQFPEAIALLERGLLMSPFKEQRKYFSNALAAARIKQQDFNGALSVFECEHPDRIGIVLQFHAYAALRRTNDAFRLNISQGGYHSAKVTDLRDEIARRYGLVPEQPRHDEGWLFDQECTVLLEAA